MMYHTVTVTPTLYKGVSVDDALLESVVNVQPILSDGIVNVSAHLSDQTIQLGSELHENTVRVSAEVITDIFSSGEAEYYNGEYSFTPTQSRQTIDIQGKTARENITINPIPSNYGLVTWNGSVLTVS